MTKILLVEDDKSLREIYGVRLLAEGYDIVSAGDGEEALAMAIKERPQLIISDVMMPKISGFDMLDILRSTTETKDIKVIMMTALSSEDQRARGEALGADRYLVKSQVGIEDVVRTVHEVLADAPVTSASAAQVFNAPPAQSAPRPAMPVPSRPTPPASAATQPQAAPPANSFTPPPPQPQQAPAQTSGLPQPTAPFSTARPASLGDRIIHPISQDEQKPNIAHLMEQELNNTPPQAPPVPQPTPVPSSPVLAQPAAPQAPISQPPAVTPTPPQAPPLSPSVPQESPQQPSATPNVAPAPEKPPALEFEEIPRPPVPPVPPRPDPFPGANQQPRE